MALDSEPAEGFGYGKMRVSMESKAKKKERRRGSSNHEGKGRDFPTGRLPVPGHCPEK